MNRRVLNAFCKIGSLSQTAKAVGRSKCRVRQILLSIARKYRRHRRRLDENLFYSFIVEWQIPPNRFVGNKAKKFWEKVEAQV